MISQVITTIKEIAKREENQIIIRTTTTKTISQKAQTRIKPNGYKKIVDLIINIGNERKKYHLFRVTKTLYLSNNCLVIGLKLFW